MADTPLDQPWQLFPEPELLSDMLVEVVDSENSPGTYRPLAAGAAYPDQSKYPGYIFLTQKPVSHDRVQRYWTTPAFYNQDITNWEEDYVSDSADHPVFVRRYKTRRDQYATLARGAGATLSGVWLIKITNPGSGYSQETPPTVTIAGTGSGATAVALVNPDGTISWIRLTAEGSGYTATPTVTIAAPSAGVQATAEAAIQSTSCVLIKQQTNNFPEDDPRYALFLIETRTYMTLPGPVLTTWEWQTRFDKYIKIEKRLVLNSDVPADPNTTPVTNVVTEYQNLTAVYSAKIITTIPASIAWENGGADFVYWGTTNYRWPDQVTEDPVIIVAAAITGSSFAIDYGWDIKVEEGYAGPCAAKITERYTFDPTDAAFIAALPAPTQVFPEAETIWISTAGIIAGSARADVLSFPIPMTLHPALEITTNIVPAGGGTTWKTEVAATVPTGFSTGDSILQVSEPQRVGIGNLWMVRIIEIFHP